MPKPKHASSYSLTPDAKELLALLSIRLGIPQNAVLELAIREAAKTHKVRINKMKQTA
jgi:hypothetical protein